MGKADESVELKHQSLEQGQGWDELNLCEFPIASLGDRAPAGCQKLCFEDTVWDEFNKKKIHRKLQIFGHPDYGLPTTKDEDILRFMIVLADQQNQFTDPKVYFTHYELLKMLGLDDSKKNYQRLTDAMHRWRRTGLNYKNAWRDPKTKRWANADFSILADLVIFGAEERAEIRQAGEKIDGRLSYFVWGSTFFESMQANYRKRIDLEFYKSLKSGQSKRTYSFLDKRFNAGRDSLEFPLEEFAFEKIGMSRKYDTGKIKEKLTPTITELEEKSFLVPQAKEQRYVKKGPKRWSIRLERAKAQRVLLPPDSETLVNKLVERGVSKQIAVDLVETFDARAIEAKMDVLDWKLEDSNDSTKNPAGFLIDSIRNDYAPPAGYKTKEQRQQAADQKAKRESMQAAKKRKQKEQEKLMQAEREHINKIRSKLASSELAAIEKLVQEQASDIEKQGLQNPITRDWQLYFLVAAELLKRYPMVEVK